MRLTFPFALAASLASVLGVVGVAVPAPVPAGAQDEAKNELARLVGKWKVESYVEAGVETVKGEDLPDMIVTFKKDGVFAWNFDDGDGGKVERIDPSKKVKEVDYSFAKGEFEGKIQKAIYKLEGDTFTDCFSPPGGDRPTEFKSTKENGWSLAVYKRVKKVD